MPENTVQVAVAILYQNGQFLMQLRDDIPGIFYPGCWGFFGGHLEPGEDPETGVKRELLEEIGYAPPIVQPFSRYGDDRVVRYVYHAPLTVAVEDLQLNEGWDLGLVSPEDIQRGDRYSAKANGTRPLGEIHRRVLLDFLDHDPRSSHHPLSTEWLR